MPNRHAEPPSLDRRLAEARAVLVFERLWPVAVAVMALVAAFLALSWFGFWIAVPRSVRVVGVLAFAATLVGIAAWAVRAGLPARRDALARLDRDSGDRHRPVTASQDVLANHHADPSTRALWDLHRRRLAAAVAGVRVAAPSPRVVDRDRYAARAALLLLAVAGAFLAGPDRDGRLAAAFDWRGGGAAGAGFRLDSWIDPPAYTGRPPVLLGGIGDKAGAEKPGGPRSVAAPVGSAVVVRWSGEGRAEVKTEGAVKPAAEATPPASSAAPSASSAAPPAGQDRAVAANGAEQRFTLAGDGHVTVLRDGSPLASYDIQAIPDLAPTIALDGEPLRNARGSLTLRYTIGDDYGVVGAEATFADPLVGGQPVKRRALIEPPKVALALPAAPRGLGQGETVADLSESPWAGATVTMVLTARDEGGNIGRSKPTSVVLPSRSFTQPLARALVEQRRDLVLDPDHHDRIDTALDALTLAPDLFDIPPPIFLGLRTAKTRLDDAKGDPDLVAVADLLWSMALQIEEGDLSRTERDLRALQQELKDALARNAPPEEIKRLTEALRQQLDKFLSEMAQKSEPSERAEAQPDGKARTITPQQLQSMLDRMEQAARNGDMAEAQRALDELRSVLENLKTAKRRSSRQNQAARQMNKAMSDLDRMTRDQQALRDQTFQEGRQGEKRDGSQDDADQQPGEGQQGDAQDGAPSGGDQQPGDGGQQPGDGGQQPGARPGTGQGRSGDLKRRQNALRQQLQQMQKQMRDMGLDGEQGFDAAGRAMKEAEDALGQGQSGSDRAVEAQGRALRGLQQGAQGLAKQMAQGQGQGDGQDQQDSEDGDGQSNGVGGRTGMQTDPLGRPRATHGTSGRDLNLGPGLAARAQQVLEELRRRLGDPSRPQTEQDYLERLLKRY